MMSRWKSKSFRLISMIVLTTGFFLVEIIVGYVTRSLALIADSFHMLSDVVALFVGLSSVRVAKWHSSKNTFGWARAEVMGALVNAVFLIALCFSISVESIQRFIEKEEIKRPQLLLIVGCAGLAVNIIGLVLFHEHGHSHGGGGHHHHVASKDSEDASDADGKRERGDANDDSDDESIDDRSAVEDIQITIDSDNTRPSWQAQTVVEGDAALAAAAGLPKETKIVSAAQLNMKGVFLHVLGDALGSVVVIISAILIWQLENKFSWIHYVDPALSLVLVIIILCTTIPLLRESSLILMMSVPTHIRVQDLKERLVKSVDGVLAVHEFHVWQLAGARIIASAHIRCRKLADYMKIAEQVKEFFHKEGIHSTTIQPEFVEGETALKLEERGTACALECGPERGCHTDTCCGTRMKKSKSVSEVEMRQRVVGVKNQSIDEVTDF